MLSGPLTRSVWVWELDTQSLHRDTVRGDTPSSGEWLWDLMGSAWLPSGSEKPASISRLLCGAQPGWEPRGQTSSGGLAWMSR